MADHQNAGTPASHVEESVRALVLFGQIPVFLLAGGWVGLAAFNVDSGSAPTQKLVTLLILGLLALMTSNLGSVTARRHEKLAVILLVFSLFASVGYLHYLVGVTGGATQSPFEHLYLYMPAVVLMVASKRRWAERLCIFAVVASWTLNFINGPAHWSAWDFHTEQALHGFLQVAWLFILLLFLAEVNQRMENIEWSEKTRKQ